MLSYRGAFDLGTGLLYTATLYGWKCLICQAIVLYHKLIYEACNKENIEAL